MKAAISVTNREEATQIRTALDDPAVRAFVRIIGVLLDLPSDRARARVLRFVEETLRDEAEKPLIVPTGTPE